MADNKWAVMGGLALNVEYTRKYGFEASAASKVTARLVAVPPPAAFVEALQESMARQQAAQQLSQSGGASS